MAELPMRQLATMVGISNPYLSQIENGLRAPSEQVLNLIAESLGVPVEDLSEPQTDDPPDDVRALIRRDGRLSAAQRRALVEVYDAMVAAQQAKRREKTQ